MNERLSLTPYYWRCQWTGTLLYWVFLCYIASLSMGELNETFARIVTRYGLFVFQFMFAAHLLRVWIKKHQWLEFGVKEFWQRIVAVTCIGGTLLAIINWPFDLVVDWYLPPPENRSPVIEDMENSVSVRVIVGGIFNALGLMAWTLIYWAVHMWYRNIQMKVANQALLIEQKNAQLSSLQSQLNPHFLFNSLNNIRGLIHIDADKASELITELSELLRYALMHNKDLVSLEKELEIVDTFLNLEKVRLGERLKVEQNIDKYSLSSLVPPMMLQSLVENAVKHGISTRRQGGLLTIDSTMQTDGLEIMLTNDGSVQSGTEGLGVGLNNSRQRLKLLFGEQAVLTLAQQDDKVLTRVFIPHHTLKEPA